MKTLLFLILSSSVVLTSLGLADDPAGKVQTGAPSGKISEGVFDQSKIFPQTTRQYRVYVPAQYDPSKPANLMVFMDGMNYANPDGPFRVPIVLDNLIHQQGIPVTVAVFVNPGMIPSSAPGSIERSNRSFEYDSMGDRYSKFLIDEFLPVALKDLNISDDPKRRAVGGISSGGICAFTTAWHRPDQFGKVVSHIGSFTNIRGGWAYPGLIRQTKTNRKPLRVYLQEGKDDLNNLFGNWPLANQDMAAALQFAGYPHKLVITEGGHSGNWAGQELPDALRWLWSDDETVQPSASRETKPKWQPHPDALVNTQVPQGKIQAMPAWESKIFKGTTRDWWIYVPSQYTKESPAALMVFQDGGRMQDVKGRWRVPIVLDNLIARGDMPPTIAVFIDPGHAKSKPRGPKVKPSNRSLEYDSLGDRYADFLVNEIIPEVEKKYNLSQDPNMRAIGGSSSGAICAFTAAWERPDDFRKVYSNVGSFTHLRGGNAYPSLVRKTQPKPIRIYMADTSGDIDNAFGSWPWSNQLMASSLAYMGYDLRFDWAEGYAHNSDYASSRFPEAMKWLWRDEVHRPVVDTSGDLKGDLTLLKLLIPEESWQVVAKDLGFADAPCTDSEGNFYYCDMKAPAIYRISADDATQTVIADEAVSGMKFGPDGLIYACQGSKNRVISIEPKSGATTVVAQGVTPNDLVITADGTLFVTETKEQRVTRIDVRSGETAMADTGIPKPNGIALSNDGGTLAVSQYEGASVWTFRVLADGKLDAKMPTMELRLPIDPQGEFKFNQAPPYSQASQGDGMAVDRQGRFYVTSEQGIQIFDPTGRPCGVLPKPDASQPLTSCVLAGKNQDYLYVTNGQTIFRRRLALQE
jgi:enterochelin esterase-like enzyme/sugar lactone lactonase YvrE